MYLLDVFRRSPARLLGRGPLFAIGLLVAAGAAGAAETERYTYFRSLEGEAELSSSDGSRAEAEANYPILVGDRLRLGSDGRADVLLADGSQLTVAGGSELVFDDLAYSADGPAKGNVLRLVEGRVFFASHGAWSGQHEQPIVDTQNARVYLKENGSYVVTASAEGFTEVTVRDGFAEVVDQRGSSIARAGESVEVVGARDPRAEVLVARGETEIEAWARDQEDRHGRGSDPYLEEPLESTATLADHGEWLQIDSRRAWRPYVTVKTWRPYFNGRWAHTPRGLYWVSSDPWSPVTYHYGSWEYDMYHGWVWYPAYHWAPAHVYWYWGPSYTAWVPIGYYSRHYRGYYPGFGLRFGTYGWVGGGRWDPFYDWTFCPSGYLRHRRPYHYYRSGREFAHHGALERGILTTDTGHLGRDQWDRPELVRVALERGWQSERGGQLPDVNGFVDRPSELPENVARQVLLKPNPTGRGFDEPVAAVLPRNARDTAVTGAGPTSSRQALPRGPAATTGATGDRRVASRQGGDDDTARTAATGSGVGQRAVGSRPTVSREGGSPSAGQRAPSADSGSTRPASGSSGAGIRAAVPRAQPGGGATASDDRRTAVQRSPVPRSTTAPSATASSDRRSTVQRAPVPRADTPPAASAGADRRTSVQRAPVPRADTPPASSAASDRRSTVQRSPVPRASAAPPASSSTSRQSVGTPREPVRRVVDGIRGRSRPTASAAGASPARPTVQRSPVPRSTAAPAPSPSRPAAARQPVSRAPSSTQSAPPRRPESASPPPRSVGASGSSSSRRESISRAPVAGSGGYQRQPVRTPSRPSYASPSTGRATPSVGSSASRAPVVRSAPRASSPSVGTRAPVTRSAPAVRSPSSGVSRPTYSRPSRVTTPSYTSPRPSTSSSYARPSPSRASSPAVSRSAPQRPSAGVSRAPSSGGSSGSSRATAAPARSGGASSRATTSGSRPTGRPGSSRPGSGGDR